MHIGKYILLRFYITRLVCLKLKESKMKKMKNLIFLIALSILPVMATQLSAKDFKWCC